MRLLTKGHRKRPPPGADEGSLRWEAKRRIASGISAQQGDYFAEWTVGVTNDPECSQYNFIYSSIAQLVEHAAVNRRVVGSSPTWGATSQQTTLHSKIPATGWDFLICFVAAPLSQKGTFASAIRLQARS